MQLKSLLRSRLLELVTLVTYALGAWWRVKYILSWHDPRKFVYSDMKMYHDLGFRLAKAGYEAKPSDVTHPPGVSELIAFFARRNEDLASLVHLQLVLALLVPLCVGFLGWVTFGKRTAYVSAAIASLYYPFIEYGGYFLAEIYMMVLVPLTLGTYLLAMQHVGRGGRRGWGIGLGLAALSGFLFFLALSMKMVAMPAVVGFIGLHFVFTAGPARKARAAVAGLMLLTAAPGTMAISKRCTEANEGTFCLGSNKSGADFLLGHYGRIQGISWKPKKGANYSFGSPSAYQHGYRDIPEVPYGLYDSKSNQAAAWKWIRKNPVQSVVLSAEHVADSFVGALPWPAYATNFWVGAQAAHYLFILMLLFPTGVLLVDVIRQRGVVGFLKSDELALFSPIFGVCLAVAIATGEIRYRLPWDCSFIILAVEFYRRLKLSFREVVVPAGAASVATAAAVPSASAAPRATTAPEGVAPTEESAPLPSALDTPEAEAAPDQKKPAPQADPDDAPADARKTPADT